MKGASDIKGTLNGLQQAPNGVLIIDKPADMTSADVVNRVKRLPGVKKAGHTGTLDPFATGVLVCPINRATRLAQFFLHGRKTYAATLHLGIETDTQDHTGRTVATHTIDDIGESAIYEAVSAFVGEIEQVPPAFSALKHEGVPLYKHARKGRPIEKPSRRVRIERLDVVAVRLPEIDIEVSCSGGTYIRTLCADIGRRLGCGGHLCRLKRTKTGGKTIAEAASLSELQAVESVAQLADFVVPMADAIDHMAGYVADAEVQKKVQHGRPLSPSDFRVPADLDPDWPYVKITDADNGLLAVVHVPENKFEYPYCCVFH